MPSPAPFKPKHATAPGGLQLKITTYSGNLLVSIAIGAINATVYSDNEVAAYQTDKVMTTRLLLVDVSAGSMMRLKVEVVTWVNVVDGVGLTGAAMM